MAKKKGAKKAGTKRSASGGAGGAGAAGSGAIGEGLQRMNEVLASAGPAATEAELMDAAIAAAAVTARGSTVVPRANVGSAVQAAVTFEEARRVIAEALDESRGTFRVSWE